MATFKIILDTRFRKKDNKYNLAVRVTNGNEVIMLNITSLSKKQYSHVFIKQSLDDESVDFREDCNRFLSRCERIFSEIKPFDKSIFRERVFKKECEIKASLYIKDMFLDYIKKNDEIKIRTKDQYRTAMNVFETFHPNSTIWDVTPTFLRKFEISKKEAGCSLATINSYQRHLRGIINYYMNVEKIIPKSYEYPFGKGGYSISSYFPSKLVLSEQEIIKVINHTTFSSKDQEYAHTIWKMLYYINGSNFADLLRLRWSDINGGYIKFFRKKTEQTRKNNIRPVIVPVISDLEQLINKVGVKDSQFILGKLNEGYTERTFINKCHKMRQTLNRDLTELSNKLGLVVSLKLETARDCYATSLLRAHVPHGDISEMLNHSNVIVTQHYLGSISMERTAEINDKLITTKILPNSLPSSVKKNDKE